MEIQIEDYLSQQEIKDIVIQETKKSVSQLIGTAHSSFVSKLLRQIIRDEIEKIIPNFSELMNNQITEEVSKLKLHDFFTENMGWRSKGNKLINEILSNNNELINNKIKEIFQTIK